MRPINHALLLATTLTGLTCLTTPSARAACNPNKTAATFDSGPTAYWFPATTMGTASFQAWQLGNPGVYNSAGCPSTGLFVDGGPGWSLHFELGSCGLGCTTPNGDNTLALLVENRTAFGGAEFLLDTVAETPAAVNNYDFGLQGDHTMIPIPRPRIISSFRSGTSVFVNVQYNPITAGLFGPGAASAVDGYRMLGALSTTDPGRDPSAYTLLATIPAPGGGVSTVQQVAVNCSSFQDQWIVTQLSLENGAILSTSVSNPARIRCNPALADPKPTIVPKKIGPPTLPPD